MEESDIAHLAGLIDGVGSITVNVSKTDQYSVGYQLRPFVRIHRRKDDEAMLGKLDYYCEEQHVQYSLSEKTDAETYIFEIFQPDSIERFLEPMLPYLVSTHRQAVLMLDEIIPAMKDDKHLTMDGLYDLMGPADELRKASRYGPDIKYDQEYFAQEWLDELDT